MLGFVTSIAHFDNSGVRELEQLMKGFRDYNQMETIDAQNTDGSCIAHQLKLSTNSLNFVATGH